PFLSTTPCPTRPTPFPYTTLFRSAERRAPARTLDVRGPARLRRRGAAVSPSSADGGRCSVRRSKGPRRVRVQSKDRPSNARWPADRKSTRLNSSHLGISYAVFCLK